MNHNEPTVQSLFDLTGRVAIVTGASGWLGSAMSRALAEAGATLAVTSRDAESAETFAASLPRANEGSSHRGYAFAQADTDSIPAFTQHVIADLGQIDILVNNAYGGTAPQIDTATAADFDNAYHTGVTAYFLLAREVANHLRSRNVPGSIINIASMYGVVASYPEAYADLPVNSPPNYHGLKGGLVHLTRHLAAYWAQDHIRVNAISPGAFPKPVTKEEMPEFIARLEKKVPLGRMGLPEELKGICLLLASAELAQRALATGAFVAAAHPQWYTQTEKDIAALGQVDAIEIYNGVAIDSNDRPDGWYLADIMLGRGHRYFTYAADDYHGVKDRNDFARGWVHVRAEELTPEALVAALKQGHFYSSTGPQIHDVSLSADRRMTVRCSPASRVFVTGSGPTAAFLGGSGITEAEFDLSAFKSAYCRVTVRDHNGERAWTNPVWFDEA